MSANPRLIVAGSSSSVPRPDRACSSYLIEDGESSVVFDLGSGSLANLRRYVDYDRVGAIVISHMHADHFLDLIPLRYALRYGSRQRKAKLPIYLPPGGLATLKRLVSAFADEGGIRSVAPARARRRETALCADGALRAGLRDPLAA